MAAWPAMAGPGPGSLLRLERSLDSMGTTYTIAVYGSDRYALDSALDDAFEEARRLDNLLSNYRPESEWSRVNREAPEHAVKVSTEMYQLLAACVEYSRESEGAFDITVGPLMKIWGFYKGTGRIPHKAEIRTALSRIGWRHIHLDSQAGTVRFDEPVEMDPGGIGKGYAVDRMAAILKKDGVTSGIITAGRSSIYAIGVPPNETRGWRVTIPNPRNPKVNVAEYFLKDESMSTSGTSEKFFVAGGTTYSHIMDPRKGYPAQGMLSVSVIAPRTIDTEAWTKPYFILGRQWAAQHKPKQFRVFLCEDRSEIACVSLP
ncbi:FAD:protein FMN transferase [uncultured Paludibaculum sp.]|uniref:FAD:protein FMN transferase n=1 Tax=uncultured Paludibaculum sp. TaxID=1765020 RepID=UPI002AAB8CF4|nr:FAD:protein FMN transferase [uncultured Paludibaculum sp.]